MKQTTKTQKFTKKHLLWLILIIVILAVIFVGSRSQSINSRISTHVETKVPCHKEATATIKDLSNNLALAELQPNTTVMQGQKLELLGTVKDTNCQIVAHARVREWQSGSEGTSGAALQTEVYTDENGRYTIPTIMPNSYAGRAPHINIAIFAPDSKTPAVITQLFFPNSQLNRNDPYYDDSLILRLSQNVDSTAGIYNFIIQR
jgi:protocatechuate 3,4-dioxygenase beta subunit